MNFFNLLAENVSEKFIEFTVEKLTPDPLNWIAKAISWIFNLFSDAKFGVALGVILFTVKLKTVVLPLDIYSFNGENAPRNGKAAKTVRERQSDVLAKGIGNTKSQRL